MARRLNSAQPGFETEFAALLAERRGGQVGNSVEVAKIIADVRAHGDAALLEYTARFAMPAGNSATMENGGSNLDAGGLVIGILGGLLTALVTCWRLNWFLVSFFVVLGSSVDFRGPDDFQTEISNI